ncbi:hypothetical protein N9K16_04170 [Alphaproteobacteria bacterium]|nr:hypothetical protein [Alphaproteobacteria bacterium]
MAKFVFAYHGGQMPESPEEGQRVMAAWGAWMQSIGPALVDGGNPVGQSKTVTAAGVEDNGGSNPLSGYSLVEADSIEAAIEIAKGCPVLVGGHGSVEVAEAMAM